MPHEIAGAARHANLWLYFSIVLGVVVLPGLDMAIVLASSLVGGRRAGFAALAGIITGGVGHVVMGVLGIGLVLRVFPGAFNVMLLVGAAYVAWIGVALLRAGAAFAPEPARVAGAWPAAFGRGMLTNLLNPKAYLYTLAILPQFLRPAYGPLVPQAAAIVAINAATQAVVYGAVALFADRARRSLSERPAAGLVVARAVGALLVGAALFTGWEGWRWR